MMLQPAEGHFTVSWPFQIAAAAVPVKVPKPPHCHLPLFQLSASGAALCYCTDLKVFRLQEDQQRFTTFCIRMVAAVHAIETGSSLLSVCSVVATCRSPDKATDLHQLHQQHPDRLSIQHLDLADAGSIEVSLLV